MKQWDIYLFPFRTEQAHPAVIISPDGRCLNPNLAPVNALICASVRLNREPKINEAIIDEADGLDWKTGVRCDVIYLLPKVEFWEQRGRVSEWRRPLTTRKPISVLRLPTS